MHARLVRSAAATTAIALLLGACGERKAALRPDDQPLARLITAQARADARRAESAVQVPQGTGGQSVCAEILRISEQAKLVIDRQPGRVTVDASKWEQLPVQARSLIEQCLRQPAAGEKPGPIQIVQGTP